MDVVDKMMCRMYVGRKHYKDLDEEHKSLYTQEDSGFCVEFPAVLSDGATLGDSVLALVETTFLEGNSKYEIKEDTKVSTELYKLGKSDVSFNILVTIQYKEEEYKKKHYEMLVFMEKSLTENCYSFELIGDQTMFNMDY